MKTISKLLSASYEKKAGSSQAFDTSKQSLLTQLIQDPLLESKPHRHCPVCFHDHAVLIAEIDRDGIPLNTGVCNACGLIFSLSVYTPDSMSRFYSTYYRHLFDNHTNADGTLNDSLHQKYTLKGSYKIPHYVSPHAVVLELGCGGGWALLPFHKAGFTYYRFDYDSNYIHFGNKHYHLNLYQGGVDEAINQGIKADYLFMNHVLEHTPDPVSFLESIKPLLTNNAIINISVPSVNFMYFGGGGSPTRLLDTLQIAHTVLFDKVTLTYAVRKAGFSVLNCIGGNILIRYSSTLSKAVPASPKNRGSRILMLLKFFELTHWRMAWLPAFLKEKAMYLHYCLHPIISVQRFIWFKLFKLY